MSDEFDAGVYRCEDAHNDIRELQIQVIELANTVGVKFPVLGGYLNGIHSDIREAERMLFKECAGGKVIVECTECGNEFRATLRPQERGFAVRSYCDECVADEYVREVVVRELSPQEGFELRRRNCADTNGGGPNR